MSLPVRIVGKDGTPAAVGSDGTLAVGGLQYDETSYNAMAVDNQVYNFYVPLPNHVFILTGLVCVTDKNILADTTIIVYEADSQTETTVDRVLLQFAMTKNSVVAPTPLRILGKPGKWVNAKTSDSSTYLTVFGYYIPDRG